MSTGEKVTKTALAELLSEGLSVNDVAAIAQALRVSKRSVGRGLVRHGYREPRPAGRVIGDEMERVRILAAEGMLPTWIGEDVGRSPSRISKVLGPMPERNAEWRSVWQQIRRNPELLKLHNELRPKQKGD